MELAEKASCKARVMLEVCSVESPLVLEEGFQVLAERGRESLQTEPFGESRLEREEVAGFAGIDAAHIGVKENAEVWWYNVLWSKVRM